MSSVGLPRSDRAAARLMAVVVLPTPPFWLAMATIIGRLSWKEAHDEGAAIVGSRRRSVNETMRRNS